MVNFRHFLYWEDQEDEIHEVVGIIIIKFIKVQLDNGMQGREKEAIYNQVLRNEHIDIGLTIASNNLIPVKDQNIFDSKKSIKAATVKRLEAKLNFSQRFS